ncbi:MAG: DJ-1/PfpI family protein [Oscillospiraceae bacterium]|nr:DJ-1/PfpI family protein [Oscillospiraceae bacterium]
MIYIFLANGFEEIEAITPIDLLRRAGKKVVTCAVGDEITILGSHAVPFVCDMLAKDCVNKDLEGVILPGGKVGTMNLMNDVMVRRMVTFCYESDLVIGAICAAPSILGRMGILEEKKAVCYPGFEDKLVGAEVLDVPAVTDGKIITARGAGAALEFSYELISAFCGKEKADEIAQGIVWNR